MAVVAVGCGLLATWHRHDLVPSSNSALAPSPAKKVVSRSEFCPACAISSERAHTVQAGPVVARHHDPEIRLVLDSTSAPQATALARRCPRGPPLVPSAVV